MTNKSETISTLTKKCSLWLILVWILHDSLKGDKNKDLITCLIPIIQFIFFKIHVLLVNIFITY